MRATFKKLSAEKQTQIFLAAFKVFAQKGYYQANVADICNEAGISNGALYKYFANKEALFISCFDFGIELMAEEIFNKGLSGSVPFYDKIRHLLKKAAEFSKKHSDVVAVYLDLGSVSHNKFARMFSTKIEKRAQAYYVELVNESIQKGEVSSKADPEITAYIIDNNLMILAFSIVSEHYNRRFQAYFGSHSSKLDVKKKIEIILKSIRQLLKD